MIPLFNLLKPTIPLSTCDHLLHGKIVTEFEQVFAQYVAAKYACATSSCTAAIHVCLQLLKPRVRIPAMIPPTVANIVANSGCDYTFVDRPLWVGGTYNLAEGLTDSAHEVVPLKNPHATVYSFYPTKPCGGIEGGMIVSNDESFVEECREIVMNGMCGGKDSWERKLRRIGWKYYMTTSQAMVAYKALRALPRRLERIAEIRQRYNEEFGYSNTSSHLYRLDVADRGALMDALKANDIQCGIHYHCLHNSIYRKSECPSSEHYSARTVTIPMHDAMTDDNVNRVVKIVCQQIAA